MIRLTTLAIWAASLGAPCMAQESEQCKACLDTAMTQAAMNRCAIDEARRVDTELNELYTKVLEAAGKEAGASEKIGAAERAWLSYRDAYMAAMYPATDKQMAYGSIYPLVANLLRARITRQQVGALRELLKSYSGSPRCHLPSPAGGVGWRQYG